MKKFSELNKENTKVEESTNKADFIKNLINETLSIEEGKIKGIDILAKTLNSIMDLNESKTKVQVLENVKAMSAHSFNFLKINEAIELEKTIIKNYALFINEDGSEGTIAVANIEEVGALVSESVHSKCKCGDDCKCDDECDCEKINESEKTIIKNYVLFKSDDKNVQDGIALASVEDVDQAIIDGSVEETFKEIKESVEERNEVIKKRNEEIRKRNELNPDEEQEELEELENEDEEKGEDAKDIEEQEVFESFVTKVQFLQDPSKLEIDELYKLMENINTEEVLNEDHLTSKDDRIKYILDCVDKKECKKTIIDFISKLPSYVKDGSINKTVKQLSDKEVEKLYKKCEECCK